MKFPYTRRHGIIKYVQLMHKLISTLARCNVVLVISIFVAPVILPKGSSSFVNKSIRLSAVFADLKYFIANLCKRPYICVLGYKRKSFLK